MGQPALGSARPEASPPPPLARLTTPLTLCCPAAFSDQVTRLQPARGSLDPLLVLHQQVVGAQTINRNVTL